MLISFGWDDTRDIVEALETRHPDLPMLGLDLDRLAALVADLPDLDDDRRPEDIDLMSIKSRWMARRLEGKPQDDRSLDWEI